MSSLRNDNEEGRDLKKPFLHTGSWFKINGRRQSSLFGSTQAIRDSSISVIACVLIVALGPIQFGFTVCIKYIYILFSFPFAHFNHCMYVCMNYDHLLQAGYTSPTQSAIITDLGLSVSEV